MTGEKRPLEVLIPLIEKDLAMAKEAEAKSFRAAGEMLWEAMPQFPSSKAWERWLRENFDLDPEKAWRLMHLAGAVNSLAPTPPPYDR